MVNDTANLLLRHLRKLTAPARHTGPDHELLRRFSGQRDEGAFEELLRRHGAMVLGVCQRMLRHRQDAEDVFQATFLTLARKAASIRKREAVGCWLHGVARCLALQTRTAAARRRAHEGQIAERTPADPLAEITLREAQAVLDEELARLPERLRAPLVLCHLEGATRDEAARQLGWSLATLKRRLEQGRELLRLRLARRGLAPSAALLAGLLAEKGTAGVPAALASATVKAALLFGSGQMPAAGTVSAQAAALAEGMAGAALLTKLKIGAALVLVLSVLAIGVGLAAHQAGAGGPEDGKEERGPKPPARLPDQAKSEGKEQARTDRHGDPLPAGVLARMGSGRLRHGEPNLRAVVFSPDSRSLASAARDGLRVWDTATGKLTRRFDLEADWGIACDFSAAGITVASIAGPVLEKRTVTCQVLDPATGEVRRRIELKVAAATALAAISPGGKRIAVFGDNPNPGGLRLYDTASGQEALRIPVQQGRFGHAVAFAPDGKTIAVCARVHSDTVRIHDATNGQVIRELKRDRDAVFNVAFSPDGRFLASVPRNDSNKAGEVSIWDLNTGKERYRLKTDPGYVRCATFSPDGRLVATAGWDRHVILWDLATGKEVRRLAMWYDLQNLAFAEQNLAFSPDGKVLATTLEGAISLWEVATGQRLPASAEPDTLVHDLYFAGDGQRLISVVGGLPIIWDCATGRAVRRFPDVRDFGILPQRPPVISPDESLIATQGEGGTIRLHDAATGKEVRVLREHEKYVRTMLFSADGRHLYSSGRERTIRAWEVTTGRELLKLTTNNDEGMIQLAASADGRWLASLTDSDRNPQGRIVVWDLTIGREAQRFKMRHGQPTQLTFSPDGRLLAAACGIPFPGEPGRVQVWDVITGKEYAEFVGHKEHVLCLAFSADGRMLATGGFDHTVRLWELASGRQRAQFNGHEGSIYAVAFSPNGRVLAAASPDAPIYLWDVTGRLEQPRQLTPAELEQAWTDLRSEDATTAFHAVRRLAAAPEQAVPFLKQQVRPAATVDAKRLTQLIADLDNERFEVRQQATEELEKLGELAEPALRKALAGQPTLEARRRLEQLVERLAAQIPSLDRLRTLRAVEVLEHISTSEARQVLESLAKGAPEARLTREAKAALQRLDRQSAKP